MLSLWQSLSSAPPDPVLLFGKERGPWAERDTPASSLPPAFQESGIGAGGELDWTGETWWPQGSRAVPDSAKWQEAAGLQGLLMVTTLTRQCCHRRERGKVGGRTAVASCVLASSPREAYGHNSCGLPPVSFIRQPEGGRQRGSPGRLPQACEDPLAPKGETTMAQQGLALERRL